MIGAGMVSCVCFNVLVFDILDSIERQFNKERIGIIIIPIATKYPEKPTTFAKCAQSCVQFSMTQYILPLHCGN